MTYSAAMLGSFERNILGVFIYKSMDCYSLFRAQGMVLLGRMPRSFNIWQGVGQLRIWLLAKGWT